jgi:hypothetical protein
LKLWIDASVARKVPVFRELATKAAARGVTVVVHAHVHLELCSHFRCAYGDSFSPSHIETYLEQMNISIATMHLDRDLAERWAARLHARFPSKDA